jgi:hypothetical protein
MPKIGGTSCHPSLQNTEVRIFPMFSESIFIAASSSPDKTVEAARCQHIKLQGSL